MNAKDLIGAMYAHVSPAAREIIDSYTLDEQARLSVRSEEEFSTVFLHRFSRRASGLPARSSRIA